MVDVMVETSVSEITKADVGRFLASKHISGCSVCGRFRSRCDVDARTIICGSVPSIGPARPVAVDIVAIVCESCGATQFHSRVVIAEWLKQQRSLWEKAACEKTDGSAVKTAMASRLGQPDYSTAAALAAAFLFVLIAALLLHSYGGAELWVKPTIATAEIGSQGALKSPLSTMHRSDLAP